MALIEWNEKYSVGVKNIDNQHIALFDILNELHAAMTKGQARSMTGPMLRKLVDYTQKHFAAEESLLTTVKYPGLTEHSVKHRDLIKQVEDYSARFDHGEITLSVHLLNFVRDWLSNHILKVDQEYSSWMDQHGAR